MNRPPMNIVVAETHEAGVRWAEEQGMDTEHLMITPDEVGFSLTGWFRWLRVFLVDGWEERKDFGVVLTCLGAYSSLLYYGNHTAVFFCCKKEGGE